ncbi:similar to Kazachstania africana KAFR_0E02570 hypothetical protein [Maudiozyma barnettii]|uniref:F-box domain-containing protein n=1 Tax=Maudiozyma barnettii TaxID=61262 RepID=A0A8H2VGJ0_9SACH|nr:uncharacterized protein KABA2_05S06578 [Kazachstania barnettii]CAB4255021.1 similar to Kazachstania africana KAFR_0E02570 hypothetical protein [Kazachstania barnettii]CAD1783292.1 similar to Kazachstania africana KAFR_0E02570 hypothetical protein [Kazachstania barnettii]
MSLSLNYNKSHENSLNFPLTIVLQIFSYLDIDELTELYETCQFFRVLIHKAKLSPECSTIGLKEQPKLTWVIEHELQSNKYRTKNMGNVVLSYVKAIRKVNDKIKDTEYIQQDISIGQNQGSPTLSTLSRSSVNSLFSDDEWNFSLDESLPSPVMNEEPILHNIDKVKDTMKVKEKALLFERLMSQENEIQIPKNPKQLQQDDALYERFNGLQNLILPKSNNNRNITDQYLMKVRESETKNTYIPKKTLKNDKEPFPKTSYNNNNINNKHNFSQKYQQHLESMNKPTRIDSSSKYAPVKPIKQGKNIKNLYENKIINQ